MTVGTSETGADKDDLVDWALQILKETPTELSDGFTDRVMENVHRLMRGETVVIGNEEISLSEDRLFPQRADNGQS